MGTEARQVCTPEYINTSTHLGDVLVERPLDRNAIRGGEEAVGQDEEVPVQIKFQVEQSCYHGTADHKPDGELDKSSTNTNTQLRVKKTR